VDPPLLRIVEARLDADGAGDHDWAMLVLAVCEGAEALDTVLGGGRPCGTRARRRDARRRRSGLHLPPRITNGERTPWR